MTVIITCGFLKLPFVMGIHGNNHILVSRSVVMADDDKVTCWKIKDSHTDISDKMVIIPAFSSCYFLIIAFFHHILYGISKVGR